jgi:methionyl-tRNA formyltransferase
MKVGFAGTPAFAAEALAAILTAGFDVALVLTQPDRPKGRGLKLEVSPVKRLAMESGLLMLQPRTLRTEETREVVLANPLDVLVVAAYGLILPPAVLTWPAHGCLNIHASKLPRWRGAAPIQRAIEAGDPTTGITIMQMDAGLDTGPVVDGVDVPIAPRETAGTLHDKLADAGARLVVAVLRRLARDHALPSSPQPEIGATYANKIGRDDAAVDWAQDAPVVDRHVRAFDPWPGAHAIMGDALVKVWRAEPHASMDKAAPGVVLGAGEHGIDVACGNGLLRLLEVQPAAGRRMAAAAYARGHAIGPGSRFTASPLD